MNRISVGSVNDRGSLNDIVPEMNSTNPSLKPYQSILSKYQENKSVNTAKSDFRHNELRKLYPERQLRAISASEIGKSYPDYNRITPAFDIRYSGYTLPHLAKTLFVPNSKNNIVSRTNRLIKEDQYVIYNTLSETIGNFLSVAIILLTLGLAIWEFKEKVVVKYYSKEGVEHKQITQMSNNLNLIKLFASGICTAIIAWNVFKRTTVPHSGVLIKSLDKGTAHLIGNNTEVGLFKNKKNSVVNFSE